MAAERLGKCSRSDMIDAVIAAEPTLASAHEEA
jgi:hypothetical protein